MTRPDDDPFSGGDAAPSLSFKEAAPGTRRRLKITDYPHMVQSTDMQTGLKAVWPDGNPKMCAVVNGDDEQGDPCSLWAPKPSSLFAAIRDAQAAVEKGYRLKPGDVLHVLLEKIEAPKKTGFSGQKIYKAKVEVGAPLPTNADPWENAAPPEDDAPPF